MSSDVEPVPGALVLVVGPSGAGKDALISSAAATLADDERFAFPKRLVTRPSTTAEQHDVISWDEFHDGIAGQQFALHWEAHGLGYALRIAVDDDVRRGKVVVANVSRRIVSAARLKYARVFAVLVTAPLGVRRERLFARGREELADIDARLARATEDFSPEAADFIVENSGPIEQGSLAFIDVLQQIAPKPPV